MTAQEMIKAKYSGELSNMIDYVQIMAQVFGILIGGIILWRLLSRYQNRRQNERFKTDYFESSYSKHWRK
tara:strand:- start:479 stop:688 length:210 start_codon:yes stop_codon:yes gene_type:complete